MRLLGLDFGEKRIGVAVSDEDGMIATPLTTVRRRSDSQAVEDLLTLISDEQIGAIVIGEPRRLDGSTGSAAKRVRSFAKKLTSASGLAVVLTDESLTSREARSRTAGRRGARASVDALAAQILLQQALDDPAATAPLDDDAPEVESS